MPKNDFTSSEIFQPLSLGIREPKNGKNFMIGFGSGYSSDYFDAYSQAIEQVLEEAGLRPVHTEGEGEIGGPQFWEVHAETTKENLTRLLTSIHISAEEYIEEVSLLGTI